VSGAGAVAALVLLEWAVGWVAVAAWTQSWSVVRRGHFRILGYGAVALSLAAFFIDRMAVDDTGLFRQTSFIVFVVATFLFLGAQYGRTDAAGVVAGSLAGVSGAVALYAAARDMSAWAAPLAFSEVLAGAALLGAVTNGMLLGHWYLNQPGLKPWALARLTKLCLSASILTGLAGFTAAGKLAGAETQGSVLGLPGFGESFGVVFFITWAVLIVFTGAIVWMVKRCIDIRSIQSATGLYYVALLTAGVSEFMIRYLMVNAT
jgi:hypothetical protein